LRFTLETAPGNRDWRCDAIRQATGKAQAKWRNYASWSAELIGKGISRGHRRALLVVGFAVSLVMLAVVLGAGIVIGGFVWWKTRDLRKQLHQQAMRARQTHEQQVHERAGQRRDIDDVVEDVEFHDETRQK
jgi:hypothetical protein